MKAVLLALGRGLASQVKPSVLRVTLLPLVLATVLWESLLWLGLQPLIDATGRYFIDNDGYAISGRWLGWFGLASLHTAIVPLLAMWALLPFMVGTALIFVSAMAMPAIVRNVADRGHPALERRQGGGLMEMLWIEASSLVIFILLWIVTIPLCVFPWVGFVIQPLLWSWLTCRVIAYVALADHAEKLERKELLHMHRWQLRVMGAVAGVLGVAPMLLWLGGTISIVLFPVFAAMSIWLYVLIFTFSGLCFTHYGLTAMGKHRAANMVAG